MKYKRSREKVVYDIQTIISDTSLNQFDKFLLIKDKFLEKADWPQKGDAYWYVQNDGTVDIADYDGGGDDIITKKFGNCFRTESEAIKARDKIREVLKQ